MAKKQTTGTRKTKKTDNVETTTEVAVEVVEATAPPAVVETPPAVVVEVATADTAIDQDNSETDSKKAPETIDEHFDELVKMIDLEVEGLRSGQSKTVGVKFLRGLNKQIKLLKTKTSRAVKVKGKTVRKSSGNTNSGFLKPVHISKEMGKFAGWIPNETHSRVDVTKYICKYIKENNLQNPNDRRQILPDSKLCKLLNFDPKKDDKPLTYYRIQSYIKPHFVVETA